jgi:predicted DCC family thiol-disulfide oxidoreductase YuxK
MTDIKTDKAIILFDGVCNFCNGWVNTVIQRDKKNYFLFAPLQSAKGKQLIEKYQIDISKTDSVILIEHDQSFIKSTAALKVAKHLNGLFPLLYALLIVPAFIRNVVYDYIARHRYKWYGKKETCMIPTAEIREKFIS